MIMFRSNISDIQRVNFQLNVFFAPLSGLKTQTSYSESLYLRGAGEMGEGQELRQG